jgi:DNA-binding GntR family transcriptional regulator
MGLSDGDLLEARAHRGKIILTPKQVVDREYTPAQRRIVDARLAEAEDDVEAGRVSKSFSSHAEFIAELHKAAENPSHKKSPHSSR